MDAARRFSPAGHLRVLLLLCALTSHASSFQLTLLHTNDHHARVEETGRESGRCRPVAGPCFAGVARRFTKVAEIRRTERHVLLLDAGDQFQGTVWFNHYRGAEAAHFMNTLGYDAMAFGNHEFDNKVEGLLTPFLQQVNCSMLSANIKADSTLGPQINPYYHPFKVFTLGSEKVAVVGYTTAETPLLSQPGPHLQFLDEVAALRVQVDKLTSMGVNKIIALGHAGFDVDKDIAKRVKGVDVVIGGHSNTFLYTGTAPSSEKPEGTYPYMVRSDDGRDVPVVQAFAFGKYLGNLKVTFDKAGNVIKAAGNPILLDSSIAQDPVVLADVNNWKQNLSHFSTQIVGHTLVYLSGDSDCRSRECNLGNLICTAMIDNNIKHSDDVQWNHVGLCMINSGAIRTSIDERSENGTISMEDIMLVLPFGGTFDMILVKGSTLKKAFERSVHRYGSKRGEFLQIGVTINERRPAFAPRRRLYEKGVRNGKVKTLRPPAGIHVVYDVSRPVGQRVASLALLCTECRVPRYEPLHPDQEYKVVVTSYIAAGGDGYGMLRDERLKHDTGDMDISVVSKYIMGQKRVYPPVDGRIRFTSSALRCLASSSVLLLMSMGLSTYFLINGFTYTEREKLKLEP
ncbi:5'-nucleotidase [Merluccius polli]|uniref:5'-nucleotidase n=1 Tax=Merluccius polli TaxID=89951 RepID=A0AA47N6V7_MERPO|nr:5'-nucleotidase [Merluccius polli]